MKRCPGVNEDGCQNTILATQEVCAACSRIRQQQEAQIALAANQGVHELEEYLDKWARFEERYGPN